MTIVKPTRSRRTARELPMTVLHLVIGAGGHATSESVTCGTGMSKYADPMGVAASCE